MTTREAPRRRLPHLVIAAVAAPQFAVHRRLPPPGSHTRPLARHQRAGGAVSLGGVPAARATGRRSCRCAVWSPQHGGRPGRWWHCRLAPRSREASGAPSRGCPAGAVALVSWSRLPAAPSEITRHRAAGAVDIGSRRGPENYLLPNVPRTGLCAVHVAELASLSGTKKPRFVRVVDTRVARPGGRSVRVTTVVFDDLGDADTWWTLAVRRALSLFVRWRASSAHTPLLNLFGLDTQSQMDAP